MSDYRQRVVEEKTELDDKIERLKVFMNTVGYKNLAILDRRCLYRQLRVMELYSDILDERTSAFT